jgi:hypothetical protein
MAHALAIYEIDKAYGGPEEGGWWFDTGERLAIVRHFDDPEKAFAACRRANAWLDRIQTGQRPVSSVLYNGGRLAARVYRNPPAFFPQERPRYE